MTITTDSLDGLFSRMPTGSLDRAILNNLKTLNHRQTKTMVPSNKEMPGYTFFVRPQLNMQKDNLRNVRQLADLLSDNPTSIQAYIRATLDPRIVNGCSIGKTLIPGISCPVIDNKSAFINVLTNNLETISGWPSIAVPTFTSDPGLYNESYTMVDGKVRIHEVFDITANFRNTRGDPVLFLFYVWSFYMSCVFEGTLVPYLDMITENEIDYNTRIYRLVTDYQKKKVTKIAACHAAIPVGVPVGDAFDVPGDQTYLTANKDISMTFKCMGVDYFDSVLIREFNQTVKLFNPSMEPENRERTMYKIPYALLNLFNTEPTYPQINTRTMELEWWTDLETFNRIGSEYLDSIASVPEDNEAFEGE